METDRQARIRERAYHIWLDEGRPEGRHDEHWHRAELAVAEEERKQRAAAADLASPIETRAAAGRAETAAKRRPRRAGSAPETVPGLRNGAAPTAGKQSS